MVGINRSLHSSRDCDSNTVTNSVESGNIMTTDPTAQTTLGKSQVKWQPFIAEWMHQAVIETPRLADESPMSKEEIRKVGWNSIQQFDTMFPFGHQIKKSSPHNRDKQQRQEWHFWVLTLKPSVYEQVFHISPCIRMCDTHNSISCWFSSLGCPLNTSPLALTNICSSDMFYYELNELTLPNSYIDLLTLPLKCGIRKWRLWEVRRS